MHETFLSEYVKARDRLGDFNVDGRIETNLKRERLQGYRLDIAG
jgi:hypothetical protein